MSLCNAIRRERSLVLQSRPSDCEVPGFLGPATLVSSSSRARTSKLATVEAIAFLGLYAAFVCWTTLESAGVIETEGI
ncbi:hypothetical protein [Haloarcula nitratireducens]|uniref:Uncharacterized protein n=1 Tax=Haloarcula nitratireducens TaxID=2487749 RepID=A0AAW4P9E5_9EURY|nr:hypothetical protein [Halomicroarcula nitratireducens]MBX0294378.1 hypothetical protein [Halomicroarcula nitratireducens]